MDVFGRGLLDLERWGLIVPARGKVDWGQLRIAEPVCRNFGFSRGTPIDRYYLHRFVGEIRSQVKGKTLEVGGVVSNAGYYGFGHTTDYHVRLTSHPLMLILPATAHDASLIATDTFDSVVCFNVLEHCAKPWIVVENIDRWLRKGGKAFCMVPNAQRIYSLPCDYWRPLPSACEIMFSMFARVRIHVYGNLITHTASHYGIACEELKPEELESSAPRLSRCHVYYPEK